MAAEVVPQQGGAGGKLDGEVAPALRLARHGGEEAAQQGGDLGHALGLQRQPSRAQVLGMGQPGADGVRARRDEDEFEVVGEDQVVGKDPILLDLIALEDL